MQLVMSKLLQGMIFGIGALIVMGGAGIVGVTQFTNYNLKDILYKVQEKTGTVTIVEPFAEPVSVIKDFSKTPRLTVSPDMKVRYASNVQELNEALADANKVGNTVIYLLDGVYNIGRTLNINAENITMMSVSGNPYETVIKGPGMYSSIGNLIAVSGSGFVIDGLTLSDASYHLIQVHGELDTDNVIIRNTILQDSFQHMVKVSYDLRGRPENISNNGLIENCIFQYTLGIAENYYTGGVDAHGSQGWVIQKNVFRDIASPKEKIAQHAVHFWVNTSDVVIRNNIFVNNDRSIGIGLKDEEKSKSLNYKYEVNNAIVDNNLVINTVKGRPFSDVGIIIEGASNIDVINNVIFIGTEYPNSIEYRWNTSRNLMVRGNVVNKKIQGRDGADAIVKSNELTEELSQFLKVLKLKSEQLLIESLYE